MPTNLSEFVALVHEQMQTSFEFAQHISTLGHDSDQADVRIGLSEAEVQIPISLSLKNTKIHATSLEQLAQNGSAVDVAHALLSMPAVEKNVELTLKDRMNADLALNGLKSIETEGNDANVEQKAAADSITEHARANAKSIDWKSLEGKEYKDLSVSIADTLNTEKANDPVVGMIKLKFKTVLK